MTKSFGLIALLICSIAVGAASAQQNLCANPTELAVPTVVPFDTTGAGMDPTLAGNDCVTDLGEGAFDGLWFFVTGTGNRLSASTCNDAAYDSKIGVFCMDCEALTCITGNDDGVGCAGFTSLVEWDSQLNATYLIYVTGFLGAVGTGNLSIAEVSSNSAPPFSCIPTGACCTAEGSCLDGMTADECQAAGSAYQGDNTSCVGDFPVVCEPEEPTPTATSTATDTSTATPTPTETPTSTETPTPTSTSTSVPPGGACNETSECAAPLICDAGICAIPASPAPTASSNALLLTVALLLGIAGSRIWRSTRPE